MAGQIRKILIFFSSRLWIPKIVIRFPKSGLLQGGGSSSVSDQWDAQCGPDAIMVGLYDNDDEGDLDDIDGIKCCMLDCPHTCGKKIDSDDCVVVDLSPDSVIVNAF